MESASCHHRGRAAPNFLCSDGLAAPGIVASLSEETILPVTRLFRSFRVASSRDADFAATPHTTCPDEAKVCQHRSSCHMLEVFQLCLDLCACVHACVSCTGLNSRSLPLFRTSGQAMRVVVFRSDRSVCCRSLRGHHRPRWHPSGPPRASRPQAGSSLARESAVARRRESLQRSETGPAVFFIPAS